MLRRISPLKHPLRGTYPAPILPTRQLPLPPHYTRNNSTTPTNPLAAANPPDPLPNQDPNPPTRLKASFYISNVFPVRLAYWDPRPSLAKIREEALLERLHDIASPLTSLHNFRIESWEIARKDGGVFLHFSYIPPEPEQAGKEDEENGGLGAVSGLPEVIDPKLGASTPGRLFLGALTESAKKQGGWPTWLGNWWAKRWEGGKDVPGHTLYWPGSDAGVRNVKSEQPEAGKTHQGVQGIGSVTDGLGLSGIQAAAGNGRVWVVKGRQWTEVSEQATWVAWC
jgi:hypothetical protein